jgi:pimeloyl-ACP methyl ester carboxylesterase
MILSRRKRYLSYSVVVIILGMTAGVIYETLAKKQALIDFPPTGLLIDIGERNIHLDCRGNGSPIVVFESGFDTSGSLSWSLVHDEIAKTTRSCVYDRAGMMWSDKRSVTKISIAKAIAEDLNETLTKAGEKPPYVLVAHSFGGPYITVFTKYFSSSVAGLIFVDTSHPDQIDIFKEFKEPLFNRFSYVVMDFFEPLWSFVGLTRIFANLNDDRLVNQSIKDEQATDAYSPSSGLALTQESQAYAQSLNEAGSYRDFGNKPLYVIGAISNYEQMSDDELMTSGLTRQQLPMLINKDLFTHRDQASWSNNSELSVIYNADHYVQIERPKVVVNAVISVIQKIRLEVIQ